MVGYRKGARQVAMSGTALVAVMVLAASPAWAQAPAQQTDETTTLDELVVTGTSIRGVPPTGSNLIAVTREDIQAIGAANTPDLTHNRTALVVELPDKPGSLCRFLTPLSESSVNLKRLESRPIRGQPNQYRFYIEIEGSVADPRVQKALSQTEADGATLRRVGSYASGTRFES